MFILTSVTANSSGTCKFGDEFYLYTYLIITISCVPVASSPQVLNNILKNTALPMEPTCKHYLHQINRSTFFQDNFNRVITEGEAAKRAYLEKCSLAEEYCRLGLGNSLVRNFYIKTQVLV